MQPTASNSATDGRKISMGENHAQRVVAVPRRHARVPQAPTNRVFCRLRFFKTLIKLPTGADKIQGGREVLSTGLARFIQRNTRQELILGE